jgi:hypothetical protein
MTTEVSLNQNQQRALSTSDLKQHLEEVLGLDRFNWNNLPGAVEGVNCRALPVLPAEFLPVVTEMISTLEPLTVPLRQTEDGEAQISRVLVVMETFQKYTKSLGIEAAIQRDKMFCRILGDIAPDLIMTGFSEYCRDHADMPAPADIYALVSTRMHLRKRKFDRLQKLWSLMDKGNN